MHSISLVIVGVLLVITLCPFITYATTTETAELEEPKILPLTSGDKKNKNDDTKLSYSELWQEDDREVLIRNERGTKDSNGQGTTTGKKQNKKDKNQMNNKNVQKQQQQQQLNKSPDTKQNLDSQFLPNNNTPSPTQQQSHQTNVKKHQTKHEKHEKNSNKKHASTEKPKTKNENSSCRYTKGAWSECDPKTNTRLRTLTLKKGEGSCVQSRTIEKKCKNKSKPEKACRYEKGTWSECEQASGEMTRLDKLKSTSDSATCAPTRTMNKKCNKSKQDKQNKQRTKEKKQNDRKNRQ